MTDQVELTDPLDHSVGGMYGHIARRLFHVSMCIIPFLYFEYGEDIAGFISLSVGQTVSLFVLIAIVGEGIRLKLGFTVFGQRDYEAKQVSALAWGAFAIGMTLVTLPDSKELVYPLILSLSFGDPFLGELRRKGLDSKSVFIGGTVFLLVIWLASWYMLQTPIWVAFILAPICVAAEWPRLRWIDDNATMLLIPLCVALLLVPWF